MKHRRIFLFFFLFISTLKVSAQESSNLPSSVIYKKTNSVSLKMQILYPHEIKAKSKYPCIVFFFGGGWINGNISQFMPQANYFTARGMVCFLVDYRVQSREGSTPFESLKDAKSAIRYIRKNAETFHIYKDSLVASGGSAGGHLAAAAALINDYDDSSDDISISAKPDALVLFNPVIDNGPGGYGFDRVGNEYKNFSPIYNIRKGAPPTIIFLGTDDHLIPVETMEYYKTVMQKVGSRCDLILYRGVGHGFFNKNGYQEATLFQADQFLTSLGFISKRPGSQ